MDTIEVVVARIGKPHGIHGEVTVELRTDEPERRLVPGARLEAQPPRQSDFGLDALTITGARWHQSRLLLSFEEIGDRNAAEAARGVILRTEIPADERPEDPEEYYDHQLVGLAAYDVEGAHLGEVVGMLHGAQDILRIRTTDSREALVPFVAALVPDVDLDGGRVVIADRPGLVTPFPEDQP